MENLKPAGQLSPFKNFCISIGALPSSYKESMTYAELLFWFCDYLENTVIPAINSTGESVTELQEKYIELKNYMENYLTKENLQPMINAKLDEMVEDGTLESIISQYVNKKMVRIYTSVESMKTADLESNANVRTLGYYEINDGGSALYHITNTLPDGPYESLENGKYAELIHEPYNVNILQLGIKNDGVFDNSTLLNNITNNIKFKDFTLFFPSGIYYFENNIEFDQHVTIKGEQSFLGKTNYENPSVRGTVFKINAENLVGKYFLKYGSHSKNKIENIYFLSNAYNINVNRDNISDGETVRNTFTEQTFYNNVGGLYFTDIGEIYNCHFVGFSGEAISLNYYSIIDNINIYLSNIGVKVRGSDNRINNIRLYTVYLGLDVTGGANQYMNIRIDEAATYGMKLNDYTSGAIIDNFVTDYVNYCAIYASKTSNCVVTNSKLNRCGVLYSGFKAASIPANDLDKASGLYIVNLQQGNKFSFSCALSSNKDGSIEEKYFGPSTCIAVGGTLQSPKNYFEISGNRYFDNTANVPTTAEDIYKLVISKAAGFISQINYSGHLIECAPLRNNPENANNLYNVLVDNIYIFPSSYITSTSKPFRPGIYFYRNNELYMSVGFNECEWVKIN